MKKKIINSLKISSLLGFACNNIKADYTLSLYYNINFTGQSAIFKLIGDNRIILNNPEKCTNDFLNVVEDNKGSHDINTFDDIKSKYVPVYYYVKGDKNPKICKFFNLMGSKRLRFDGNENNVEEVVYVKKSDKKNIVTCSNDEFKKFIEGKEFLVDKDYIYNLILSNSGYSKSIDDVKKRCNININLDENNNQNIEMIYNYIFKIPCTEEFKISEKDVKDNEFIIPLNKLENLYINTKNLDKLLNNDLTIKNETIKYIFEYNSKKYYIISDKKLKEDDLFKFLKTKNNLRDKELKFDTTTPIEKDPDDTVIPREYKLIDKVMSKPKPKPIVYIYKFTGDSNIFKFNPEEEEKRDSKIKVLNMVNSNEKSNYEEDEKTLNTDKYVFVAIKEDTNQRFVNDQELEPGTYKLIREEKPKEDDNTGKGQGQQQWQGQGDGDSKKSKKMCGCC